MAGKTYYLEQGSENLAPKYNADAKKLIGKKVSYLRSIDIDKTGRGYYFPRFGTIEKVVGRNLLIDGDYVSFSELMELIVI